MGASGGELAVGLVKRQPNEKAMALILSSSDFPSNSFATLGSISFDEKSIETGDTEAVKCFNANA